MTSLFTPEMLQQLEHEAAIAPEHEQGYYAQELRIAQCLLNMTHRLMVEADHQLGVYHEVTNIEQLRTLAQQAGTSLMVYLMPMGQAFERTLAEDIGDYDEDGALAGSVLALILGQHDLNSEPVTYEEFLQREGEA